MPELREVFEMSTKQVEPDMDSWQEQEKRQRKTNRNRKVGAFAVAAAIGLAAVALILGTREGQNETTPADEPTVSPVNAKAQKVATGFLEAFGAFDADRAITYLADDASIADLGSSAGGASVEGTPDELPLIISLLEAQHYKQILGPGLCEEFGGSDSVTTLRCAFDFHLFGSDEIGLGPFSGSYFDLIVGDGEIVRATQSWEIGEFSPQMWEPFADWVSTNYPEDATVMYEDEAHSMVRLSEKSVRLWERHTPEYVATETPQTVAIAERFMAARSASDVATVLSLLPEEGATVHPMIDNNPPSDILIMGRIRMNRDELALAFEVERLLQVRYESVDCQSDPDRGWNQVPIVCSYVLDSRLRHISGIQPVLKSMRIGVRDGRIDHLSFPWLNVSFPGNVPAEGWAFIEWLQGEHPEVGAPMEDGTLFETRGQEMFLILTRESVDLLAGYLDEYERSVSR
jgi:hypothetical protein